MQHRRTLRVLFAGAMLMQSLGCSRAVVRESELQTPHPEQVIVGVATKQGQEYWFKDETGPWDRPTGSTVTIRNDSLIAIANGSPVAIRFDDIQRIYIEESELNSTAMVGALGAMGLLMVLSIAWSDAWSSSGR